MFLQRDIRGDDGAVVTSATFGLFKSSLTGNTCVSSSEKDVEWLYGWARISAREFLSAVERSLHIHPYRWFVSSHTCTSVFIVLAPLFGAILVAAILVDRSCNACCMKAMKIFLVLGSQVSRDQLLSMYSTVFCPRVQNDSLPINPWYTFRSILGIHFSSWINYSLLFFVSGGNVVCSERSV